MSELAALRRLRATNSKLMKGNLALLMSIRETDSEIEEEWRELQRCCELLEQDGRAIPPSCLALMGTADGDSPRPDQENSANDKLSTNEPDDAAPSNGEKHAGGPASSALSVRNVLNAEPSDEEEEEEEASHDSGESASNDGSADEP